MRKSLISIAVAVTLVSLTGRASAEAPLHGTVIGTPGSYRNQGQTIAAAFDGELTTAFNAPFGSGAWVGLDLGTPASITHLAYAPWPLQQSRMIKGVFQGSNTADFSSGVVTLYTVTSRPPSGVLTTVPIAAPGAFRYVRYLGAAGTYCNIAEMIWYGTPAATPTTMPTVAVAVPPPTTMTAAPAAVVATQPDTQPASPLLLLEPTVPAGTAVHVSAWGLYPNPATLFDHVLSWDFGQSLPVADPRDYAHNAVVDLGHNFPGPQAAYVFTTPGVYPITLTDRLRNADGSPGAVVQTLSTTVTVTPPGRTVFYVDSRTGNDANPGTDPAAPLGSLAAGQKKLRSNTELDIVGFLDPQTNQPAVYRFSTGFGLPFHNCVILGVGAAQPVLHAISTQVDKNLFNFDKHRSSDITLANLGIDSDDHTGVDTGSGQHKAYDVGFAELGNIRGTNAALVNDTLMHLDRGPEVTNDAHGWLMQNCRQRFACEIYSRGVYDGGDNCVYAGNVFTDSVHESPVRFDGAGGNGCNNLSFVANRVGRYGSAKAAFTDRYGVNHFIAANLFVGAECSINSPGGNNAIRNLDLRQNVAVGVGTQDGYFDIRAGVFDSCVQDNRSWQPTECYTLDPHNGMPAALYTTNLLWRNNWGCAWFSPNPNSHARLMQINAEPVNFQPDACDQFVGIPGPGPGVAPPSTMPSE